MGKSSCNKSFFYAILNKERKEKNRRKRRMRMEFMSNFNCPIRGIVLNDQQIRLFQLLKEEPKEAKEKITQFLEDYRLARNTF